MAEWSVAKEKRKKRITCDVGLPVSQVEEKGSGEALKKNRTMFIEGCLTTILVEVFSFRFVRLKHH